MRALIALLCTALFLMATPSHMILHAQSQHSTRLASLRDNTRPLLVFSPENDARAAQYLSDLKPDATSLRERDMCIVLLTPKQRDTSLTDGLPSATFSPQEESAVRKRFHVNAGEFVVILVGKDGGEKLRSSNPIPWGKLAATVDAMPMRRDEMKQR